MEPSENNFDVSEYLSDISDLPEELQQRINTFLMKLSERKERLDANA